MAVLPLPDRRTSPYPVNYPEHVDEPKFDPKVHLQLEKYAACIRHYWRAASIILLVMWRHNPTLYVIFKARVCEDISWDEEGQKAKQNFRPEELQVIRRLLKI